MGRLTIFEIARILTQREDIEQSAANSFATEMFAIIQQHLATDHLVKIKGLGTFKIIDVDARESVSVRTGERVIIDGHSKITFTPDAIIRELVNKPFSQFETVVLNEGVEFDDIPEPTTDNGSEDDGSPEPTEMPAAVTLSINPSAVPAFDSKEEPEPTAAEPETIAEEPETIAEEPESTATEPETTATEPENDVAHEVEETQADDELPNNTSDDHHGWLWAMVLFGGLAAMAASALGGYYYGVSQVRPAIDTVYVRGTVVMATQPDNMASRNSTDHQTAAQQDSTTRPLPVPRQDSTRRQPTTVEKSQQQIADKPAAALDKYEQKDERVRLGAYRIVGLDHEVKVLAGQTFYGICKAHLGPDMECYVEVYNDLPRNPTIKTGQTIRIPKLQWKKKHR